MRRLDQILDHLPDTVRPERLSAFSTLVINVLAGREGTQTTPGAATDLLVADLVDMAVGLLTAPVSSVTIRELRAVDPGVDPDPGDRGTGRSRSERGGEREVGAGHLGAR